MHSLSHGIEACSPECGGERGKDVASASTTSMLLLFMLRNKKRGKSLNHIGICCIGNWTFAQSVCRYDTCSQ